MLAGQFAPGVAGQFAPATADVPMHEPIHVTPAGQPSAMPVTVAGHISCPSTATGRRLSVANRPMTLSQCMLSSAKDIVVSGQKSLGMQHGAWWEL